MKLINKIKSNIYFNKLKNNKIKISDIKEHYLTCDICFYEIKKHINYFRLMPKSLINNDICIYIFNNCIDYFKYIPDKYKTKDICISAFNYNYSNFKYISLRIMMKFLLLLMVFYDILNLLRN